jgi:hypothetical protein
MQNIQFSPFEHMAEFRSNDLNIWVRGDSSILVL